MILTLDLTYRDHYGWSAPSIAWHWSRWPRRARDEVWSTRGRSTATRFVWVIFPHSVENLDFADEFRVNRLLLRESRTSRLCARESVRPTAIVLWQCRVRFKPLTWGAIISRITCIDMGCLLTPDPNMLAIVEFSSKIYVWYFKKCSYHFHQSSVGVDSFNQ
jgi:hypothetical protein